MSRSGKVRAGDRELLLLGLLRRREMHGYQLSEFLDTHLSVFFELKKATAYNLLGKMEEEGWVSSREEQEGKRPPRRVYAITPEGESLFQELLRSSLPDHRPVAYPGNVPVLFLDALPPQERLELLGRRRDAIREHIVSLETHMDHVKHPLLNHRLLILQAELAWMEDLLKSAGDK
ncbi:PadR family transcriptional regulator [Gemmatimonadota bacterium]